MDEDENGYGGPTLIEYSLLVTIVVVAVVAALTLFKLAVRRIWDSVR